MIADNLAQLCWRGGCSGPTPFRLLQRSLAAESRRRWECATSVRRSGWPDQLRLNLRPEADRTRDARWSERRATETSCPTTNCTGRSPLSPCGRASIPGAPVVRWDVTSAGFAGEFEGVGCVNSWAEKDLCYA